MDMSKPIIWSFFNGLHILELLVNILIGGWFIMGLRYRNVTNWAWSRYHHVANIGLNHTCIVLASYLDSA